MSDLAEAAKLLGKLQYVVAEMAEECEESRRAANRPRKNELRNAVMFACYVCARMSVPQVADVLYAMEEHWPSFTEEVPNSLNTDRDAAANTIRSTLRQQLGVTMRRE